MSKIYIKDTPKNIYDLYYKLYRDYGSWSQIPTFRDKKCTIVECPSGRYRSSRALMDLGKTYFSKMTRDDMIASLFILMNINDISPKFGYCTDIRKLVFYHQAPYFYTNDLRWGKTIKKINNKDSYKKIKDIVLNFKKSGKDFNNNNDINELINKIKLEFV